MSFEPASDLSQSGSRIAASRALGSLAMNISYSILPLRYRASVPPGMKGFPRSFLSTTFVSTRLAFGKRRDSSAGLAAAALFTETEAEGFGSSPQEDRRRSRG